MKKLLAVVFALSVMTVGIFAQDADSNAADALAEAATTLATETTKASVEIAAKTTADAFKDVDFPTGTWIDEKWNAEWVMDVAKVHLYDGATGELIYTFTKNNTENFKFVPSSEGLSLSFYCKETERAYKITKPLNFDKDLKLYINPDWTDEDYNVTLKFKSVNIPQ